MRGVNKVILVGTLGQDPEARTTGNGNAVTTLSMATSEQWVDKQSGQRQERTEWHRVVLWGKVAEIGAQYLRKGSQCYIEGKLQTRSWEDQQGNKRYSTEVVVDMQGTMQLLGGRPDNQGGQQQQRQPQQQRQGNRQGQQQRQQQNQQAAPPDNFDDDIPFAPLHHLAGA